jgi:hypothetical protein
MADDDLEDLTDARAALVNKRLSWARTIAIPGDIAEGAIRGLIEVQKAIEVIDIAIEELEEEELQKELENEDSEEVTEE